MRPAVDAYLDNHGRRVANLEDLDKLAGCDAFTRASVVGHREVVDRHNLWELLSGSQTESLIVACVFSLIGESLPLSWVFR